MNYELPKPDTHCFDTDTGLDVWSYSKEQMLSLRNQTLDDAAAIDWHGLLRERGYVTNGQASDYNDDISTAIRNLKDTP